MTAPTTRLLSYLDGQPEASNGASQMPEQSDRLRDLVVDNDPEVAYLPTEVRSVHELRVAHDGFDVLDIARGLAPDLVIIDVGLPGLGHEVARRLREATEACALVALSGYCRSEDEERGLEAGFDVYLMKPIDSSSSNA